jgi:hypothetical protein
MMVFQELEINTLKFWQQRTVDKVALIAKTIAKRAK